MSAHKAKRSKKAPSAPKKSGDAFRDLFEYSPDPIYINDLKGRVLLANRTACKVMGYSQEEFRKLRLKDVDAQLDAPKVSGLIKKILSKAGTIVESRHRKRDGTVFPIEVHSRLINYLGKKAIISIARDITQRKEDEKKQAELATIIENTNDAIVCVDLDNKVTTWNKGAERVFGYTEAEIIGKPITILAPDPDKADGPALMAKIRKGLRLDHFETKRRRKDGGIIDISLTISPLKDRLGKVIGVSGAAHDITGRKEAEREIRELNLKLEQRATASETNYRLLFDNIDDTILVHDAQGNFIDINRGGLERLGYSKAEVLGMNLAQFDDPEAAARIPANMAALLKTGHAVFESVQRRKDGSGVPVEVNAMSIDLEGKPAILSVSRDLTARKLAEEKTNEQLSIFEAFSGLVSLVTLDGLHTYINSAGARMLGYNSPADIVGKLRVSDAHTPEDLKYVMETGIPAALKTGTWNSANRLLRPDGSLLPVDQTIFIVRDDKGLPRALGAIMSDTSQREQARKELEESRTLIESIVENAPFMIFLKEAKDLKFVVLNRAGEELLGYDRKVFLGRNDLDIFPPEQAAHFVAKDREVLAGECTPLDIPEERVTTAHKGLRLFHTKKVCIRAADGTTKYLLGISEDITDRKKAEEELRRQNALLKTQQDTSLDAILMMSADRKILGYNARFVEMWGYTGDVLEARSGEVAASAVLSKLKDPAGFTALIKHLYAHPEEKSRDEVELKDGRLLDRYSCGIFGPAGECYGRVWYFRDITESRRAEKMIKNLNSDLSLTVKDLREANKELEAFTYSVSHDLRTPLRHMTTFARLLDEEAAGALKEKPRHYLEVVSRSARNMDKLITTLLAFSKLARAKPEMYEFSGLEVIEEALSEIRPETHGRDIEWDIGKIPALKGDRTMLKQVFINLLSNAVKFSAGKTPASIKVFARTEGNDTVIGIRDNGIGFDMKHYDQLFGVFQRLHTDRDFEGTGVGLANVKSVISKHGGRVWAETIPDKETTFYFSLPAADNAKKPSKE